MRNTYIHVWKTWRVILPLQHTSLSSPPAFNSTTLVEHQRVPGIRRHSSCVSTWQIELTGIYFSWLSIPLSVVSHMNGPKSLPSFAGLSSFYHVSSHIHLFIYPNLYILNNNIFQTIIFKWMTLHQKKDARKRKSFEYMYSMHTSCIHLLFSLIQLFTLSFGDFFFSSDGQTIEKNWHK